MAIRFRVKSVEYFRAGIIDLVFASYDGCLWVRVLSSVDSVTHTEVLDPCAAHPCSWLALNQFYSITSLPSIPELVICRYSTQLSRPQENQVKREDSENINKEQ